MTIGVLTAMESEHRQIARLLTDAAMETKGPSVFLCGNLGSHRIVLHQCGIGKANAAAGVTALIIHYGAERVISTGVAGGTGAAVRVMDVVAGMQTAYHDIWCGPGTEPGQVQGLPRRFTGDADMLATALHLDTDVQVHAGLICTGDRFISTPEELRTITDMYPDCLAVDMESAAIAQVCHLYSVPFLSVRIISDTPGAENHQDQYLDFWKTMADRSFNVTRSFLEQL